MSARHAPQVFHVAEAEIGKTLAAVLRGRMPGVPWSQVQRLVRNRHVLIHGNLSCDEGRRLKEGEVIKVLEHPTAPPAREEDVKIRYVDEYLVVVEKPAGLTSVRHEEERQWKDKRKNAQPTLEDLLPRVLAKRERGDAERKQAKQPWKRLRGRKPQPTPSRTHPVRPVHRLDRETSGLMVFARTVPAERHLGSQFRQHTTYRRYLAIAEGEVAEQTIDLRLIRDRGDGRRGITDDPQLGKSAVTHVTPRERLGDYTLVECRLETGRTHQIRIHLSAKGHPLCGEKVYRQPLFGAPSVDKSGAPRLALHAAELGFEHPFTGEELRFSMPLPADLQKFLARLRKESQA
ncbi:MAG: RluA family pseudouridine synthase [Planctomycetaceae bacterium]|nr:RluA family pseudouridine synthase [Planctomycetaceae bacterium]